MHSKGLEGLGRAGTSVELGALTLVSSAFSLGFVAVVFFSSECLSVGH